MLNFKNRNLKNGLLAALALMGGLAMGLLSGCTPLVHHGDPVLFNANVHSVSNGDKLKSLVADATAQYGGGWMYAGVGEDTNASQTMSPGVSDGAATRDYTDTNSQVDGVAEGDIVKTDGYNIYYAARYENKIRVLSVSDDHSISIANTIDLGDVYTDSLYLTSKYLIVIGYRYNIQETSCRYTDAEGDTAYCLSYMWWQPTGTVVVIDRETLLPAYTLETDSYFMDNRLIDNSLFLVGYKYLYGNSEQELRPTFTEIRDGVSEDSVVGYDSLYYFDDTPAYGMRVLTGISLNDDPSLIDYNSSGYLGVSPDYQKMYVSLNALYLAETVYHYEDSTSYT
ncbi:MAG: beta-propeller domain-containing protein, partial [Firmicutes bacterium]|nr:beta-propeller domain-containing protein [Bacillota bacterium]